ncbi:unnamed protein product [Mycena citricolor]|uniref:Uncharacterized protein n=1 Tax=Mycena citricolor TaxID=2018698 RepID=A0AAD2HI64_9AGAR|nr:unnamed protein product [Mycena citricolor]
MGRILCAFVGAVVRFGVVMALGNRIDIVIIGFVVCISGSGVLFRDMILNSVACLLLLRVSGVLGLLSSSFIASAALLMNLPRMSRACWLLLRFLSATFASFSFFSMCCVCQDLLLSPEGLVARCNGSMMLACVCLP